jgi:hypothetical protein
VDFIFMLTRDDQTVADARDVVAQLGGSGIGHIGFKDIGATPAELRALHDDIRDLGAVSYLEVVSTTAEDALNSARFAAEIGVDRLMGGTLVDETLAILDGSGIEYFPFPGTPVGHPTVLDGSAEEIAADVSRFQALGCAGVDLLAYRTSGDDPLGLVRAARAALDGYLVVAGNVTSAAQVRDLAAAGVDGFTIGSAVFSGDIDRRSALLRSQLAAVASWTAETWNGRP